MHSEFERRKLLDIRDNIVLAEAFVRGVDFATFRQDAMRFYAVVRALEIVSEASRELSPDLKARHPQIPWRDVAGAGNVYRHDDEGVDQRRVWQTVYEALPALLSVVTTELA